MLNQHLEKQSGHKYHRREQPREAGRGLALSMPARQQRPIHLTALHEAGHAIALLASGVAVKQLVLNTRGGRCDPFAEVPPRILALAAASGALAEELEGDCRGLGSSHDDRAFQRSCNQLGLGPAGVIRQAESLLYEHREEVLYLARELDRRGIIDPEVFATICAAADSPLRAYGRFYELPQKLSRTTGPCRVVCKAF